MHAHELLPPQAIHAIGGGTGLAFGAGHLLAAHACAYHFVRVISVRTSISSGLHSPRRLARLHPGEREKLMMNAVPLAEPSSLTDANVDRRLRVMQLEADRLVEHVDLDVLDPVHGCANAFTSDGGLSPDAILRVIALRSVASRSSGSP